MSWRDFLKKDITPKFQRDGKPARWRKILEKDLTPPFLRWPRGAGLPGAWIHPVAWFAQQWHENLRGILTQLAAIVQTNSPLPDGLAVCALDAPNRRVARVFRTLSTRLESGHSLGEAMETLPAVFPQHWVDLVRAGEQTGRLDLALNALVRETNQSLEHGRIIRNRVAYFTVLFLFQLSIMSFIAIKVLPIFADIVEEFGNLPPRSLMTFNLIVQFLEQYAGALAFIFVGLLVASILGPIVHRCFGWVQSLVTYCVLPLPVLGRLHRNKNLERIAGVLQMLLAGGVPLPEALGTAAKIRISRPFQKAMAQTQQAVEGGHPMSEELARHSFLLGGTFPTLVKLGEHSNGLDESCGQARDLCRRAITRTQATLADLLVPAGVFVCGSIALLTWLATFGTAIAIGDAIIASM